MKLLTAEQKMYYALRMAAALCFIGHGAFGIITKPIWCNYFAVFGIGQHTAYQLMPVVGTIDILLGISLLLYPIRAAAAWLVIWGLFTAALRPLSGEPIAELAERAGNFGAPLALLLLCVENAGIKTLFKKIQLPATVPAHRHKRVQNCLQWTAALLLAGHGLLNLMEKKSLLFQYSSLGFHPAQQLAITIGMMEVAGALLILFRPSRTLLFAFFAWKMCSELFYPHWELLEWIERAGSYGALLALGLSLPQPLIQMHKQNLLPDNSLLTMN